TVNLHVGFILSYVTLVVDLFLPTATVLSKISTLSLHDALPICSPAPWIGRCGRSPCPPIATRTASQRSQAAGAGCSWAPPVCRRCPAASATRPTPTCRPL